MTAGLLDHRVLVANDGVNDTIRREGERYAAPVPHHPYTLGPNAHRVLAEFGVDLDALLDAPRAARPLLRFCVDWTEQRHHLAGRLGAELLTALGERKWIVRHPHGRSIGLTSDGAAALRRRLGIDLELLPVA